MCVSKSKYPKTTKTLHLHTILYLIWSSATVCGGRGRGWWCVPVLTSVDVKAQIFKEISPKPDEAFKLGKSQHSYWYTLLPPNGKANAGQANSERHLRKFQSEG